MGRNPEDIEIKIVGPRPGEKFWEELTTGEELRRTFELDDYFAVIPAFRNIYGNIDYSYPGQSIREADRVYVSSSEPLMSKDEILSLVLAEDVLPPEIRALALQFEGDVRKGLLRQEPGTRACSSFIEPFDGS